MRTITLPLEVTEQRARSLKSGLEKIVGGIHSGWDDARRRSRGWHARHPRHRHARGQHDRPQARAGPGPDTDTPSLNFRNHRVIRTRKIGGMPFEWIGRLLISFCMARWRGG
jgi:hypothetical protein